eukprot:6120739-Amphidinium_carterae.1
MHTSYEPVKERSQSTAGTKKAESIALESNASVEHQLREMCAFFQGLPPFGSGNVRDAGQEGHMPCLAPIVAVM